MKKNIYQKIKITATAIITTNAPVPATASNKKLYERSRGDSKSSKSKCFNYVFFQGFNFSLKFFFANSLMIASVQNFM